jgi:hypothetical protein
MRPPSRLAYPSPLLFDGPASVSEGAGLLAGIEGRLDAGLLVRRADGRDLGAADRGLDAVDLGLAVPALGLLLVLLLVLLLDAEFDAPFGLAAVLDPAAVLDLAVPDLAAVDLAAVDRPAVDLAAVDRPAVALDLEDAGLVVADRVADLGFAAALGLTVVAATGFAADMVFAAAVSAFAAVVMALVAVFIACMAEDIVLADDVALVAAAVIFVAADVTLVAADDTVLAADAGVAELRAELLLAEFDAVLRVDREALRLVAAVVLRATPRIAIGCAPLAPLPPLVFGRLAVPLDALRLTDLLRAVLAELRRVAARVVV